MKISSVEMAVDQDSVPPNGFDALERYGIADKVRDGVTASLGQRRAADGAEGLVLHIVVQNFRLRSGGNAFWLGGMGGADLLSVSVEVRRGVDVIKSYQTDTSTILGGIFYASPTKRSNRLVKSIAERIVAGL